MFPFDDVITIGLSLWHGQSEWKDYVYEIREYKILDVKKLFQRLKIERGKIIGKTLVVYKNMNKGKESIENSNYTKLLHRLSFSF